MPITFIDSLPVIEEELLKRRNKWNSNPITHIGFEDVCQIIRLHILEKWPLWDQKRPFKNWLNTVISNRLRNIIRDNYGNLAPPCRRCPMNQGGSLCSWTSSGVRDSSCPSYQNWIKTKKDGFELRLPSSMDNPDEASSYSLSSDSENYNLEESIVRFADKLKKVLNESNYLVFDLLYMKGESEEVVAKELGFTTSESGRKAGYKQIYNIKKKILEAAKKILKDEEVFYE